MGLGKRVTTTGTFLRPRPVGRPATTGCHRFLAARRALVQERGKQTRGDQACDIGSRPGSSRPLACGRPDWQHAVVRRARSHRSPWARAIEMREVEMSGHMRGHDAEVFS